LACAGRETSLDDLIVEAMERPLSRRDVLRRGRNLGLTVAASGFLSACGSAVSAHSAQPDRPGPHPRARYLVMLIVDAGRPDYLTYTELPNIKQLMTRGTYYDRAWVGQLEAVTPASHASISSGCFPSSDGGILGFWWEDPASGTTFNSVPLDGSDPDSLSVLMANAGTPTMAEYLKRHDARAKVYAASGQKFYAADAVGGPAADYISYFKPTGSGGWGPTCIPGHDLPAWMLNQTGITQRSYAGLPLGKQDALVGELALKVVRQERPRIMILNLPEMDWPVAHIDGGPRSPNLVSTLMKGADAMLGQLVNEYASAGILHETVFMVLGDHGVTPLERFVDPHAIKGAMETVDTVVSYDTHTGAFGWLADERLAASAANAVEQANVPNVTAVYHLAYRNGRRTYLPAPNTARATHDTLGRAYQYLLHTTAGENAPHVVCFYPERTGTLGSGGTLTPWKGDHGGPSWGSQAIPLVMAGPGVKAGHVSHFPARLVDLAPTVMRMLGVPYPTTDGIVLADCMQSPIQSDMRRQQSLASYLVPYAGALRRQSALETSGLPRMHQIKHPSSNSIGISPSY